MAAQIGQQVGLYIDTRIPFVVGDFLQTDTGRTYLVDEIRVQARGRWAGVRKHLRATVVPADLATAEDNVVQMRWYRR